MHARGPAGRASLRWTRPRVRRCRPARPAAHRRWHRAADRVHAPPCPEPGACLRRRFVRPLHVRRDRQEAITRRDLGSIRDSLTPEMLTVMQTQCDDLRQARRTNRMGRIDVRRAEVSEAWQETGQDFVTVFLAGEMLDWVVDDATGAVVEGSDREPQPFEEYWTFARPVGPSRFRLTAIQQG
ncbi:MAG: hypothetical protein DME08_19160 [Candidatus Rokuibacteriota bacterium]|nr:MAG: hypothetical protein DME08_19160 [Candidatus Rokubacteria bacterium]